MSKSEYDLCETILIGFKRILRDGNKGLKYIWSVGDGQYSLSGDDKALGNILSEANRKNQNFLEILPNILRTQFQNIFGIKVVNFMGGEFSMPI